MQIYLIGALVFALGIAIFVFQNTSVVTVHFLNWVSPEVSLAVVALVAACFGAMITLLVDGFRYFKVAKQVKDLMNRNRKLESEVKSLSKGPSHRTERQAMRPEKASGENPPPFASQDE